MSQDSPGASSPAPSSPDSSATRTAAGCRRPPPSRPRASPHPSNGATPRTVAAPNGAAATPSTTPTPAPPACRPPALATEPTHRLAHQPLTQQAGRTMSYSTSNAATRASASFGPRMNFCCSSPKEWLRRGWNGPRPACDAGGVCGDPSCSSLVPVTLWVAGVSWPEEPSSAAE